jgi:hypothetical protein
MILHAASIAAFFVDQLAQVPVQVQCVQQAAPESWLKWLLPTIVQTVVSLASITAGVLIAVWSFRKNRQAQHEQWVRDQKKAEWSVVVSKLATVDNNIPFSFSGERWLSICDGMLDDLHCVLSSMRNTLFISEEIEKKDITANFTKFVSEAGEKIMRIKGQTGFINNPSQNVDERLVNMENRKNTYREVYDGFHKQSDRIRSIALMAFRSTGANYK